MSEEKVYTEQELKAMADQLLAEAEGLEEKPAKPARKRASRKKEAAEDAPVKTVEERLHVYHEQTEPLRDYYAAAGKLLVMDGQQGIQEIAEQTLAQLKG